jgi:hypothetical protein
MQGHTFPLEFSFDSDKVSGFKIDFGYDEYFGQWTVVND